MATSSSSNGNVNLRLNRVTIDDVIKRAALNSGVSLEQVQSDFETLKDKYGKRVFSGKVALVRPDLNVPLKTDEDGKLTVNEYGEYEIDDIERIEVSVPTIARLSDYGAKVVVMAHQGRPAEGDCISLKPHKRVLEDLLNRDIIFRELYWYATPTQRIIKEMKGGDIFLLDNIRKLSDDTLLPGDSLGGSIDPKKFANLPDSFPAVLGGLADFFVNDGAPVWHRWQGSEVGFPYILNIAGLQAEKEIIAFRALSAETPRPYTMLLGGVKITDYIDLVRDSLDKGSVDYILAAGTFGIMGALATMGRGNINYLGRETRQFLEEKGVSNQLSKVRQIAREHHERFILPIDYRVLLDDKVYTMTADEIHLHPDKDKMGLYGLGPKTVARFEEIRKRSKTIYMKGDPTLNDDRFIPEARQIISGVVESTHQGALTILSGGNLTTLVKKLGYLPDKDFTTRTLAGGALTVFRNGELLAGLYMLNTSYNAFNGLPLTNGLGSYNVGFEPVAPRIPEPLRPR